MHALSVLFSLGLVASVHGHGYLKQASSAGNTLPAPAPWAKYSNDDTARIGYTSNADQTYCLFSSDFNNAQKMSCGPSSQSGAPNAIKVAAGSSVDVYWAGSTGELKSYSNAPNGFFPFVHAMGPVIDYLTSCNGDCTNFDATNAGWTKMAEFGVDSSQTISQELRGLMAAKPEVYHPTNGAGLWGMAKMIQDGSKWTLDIPESLAPGQYLWRNEISAVHSNPAQIYVGCIQIEVTGSGTTELPAGTRSDQFYTKDSLLGNFNTYTYNYNNPITLPGPAVWDGAASASSSNSTSTSTTTSSGGSTATDAGSSDDDDTTTSSPSVDPVSSGSSSSSGSNTGSSGSSSGGSSSSRNGTQGGSGSSGSGYGSSSGSSSGSGRKHACNGGGYRRRSRSLKRRL